jgi:hypothetical protein
MAEKKLTCSCLVYEGQNPRCALHGIHVVPVREGEVVDDNASLVHNPTGRFLTEPEPQRLPSTVSKRVMPAPELLKRIDFQDIESRIFNSYAGSFIGFCYDPEKNKAQELPPKDQRLIVLTDEDDDGAE